MTSAITLEEFRSALQGAVDQREHTYTNSSAISIRWEGDNTRAEEDTKNLNAILHRLGFEKAQEYIIPKRARFIAWDLETAIHKVFRDAADASGRSIVFVHYAGHGEEDSGSLRFTGPSGQMVGVDAVFFANIENPLIIPYDLDMDVVYIFDSCHSHLATRSPGTTKRIVEVLAASDTNNPLASAPGQRPSFTSKLANEIAVRKRRGEGSIEFAEIMQTLRANSPRVKPTHSVRVGTCSVRLPLAGSSANVDATQDPPLLNAVFTIRVSESLSKDGLSTLLSWLKTLNRSIGLELENVYETESMCLIFYGAYSVYTKLAGIPGVDLICETKRPNLRRQATITSSDPTVVYHPPVVSDENQRPKSYPVHHATHVSDEDQKPSK